MTDDEESAIERMNDWFARNAGSGTPPPEGMLEAAAKRLGELVDRIHARNCAKWREEGYPESQAAKTWKKGNLTFSIVRIVLSDDRHHYAGYVRFPRRPVRELQSAGILQYVPVHGGITFECDYDDGSKVYGFDCAHADDDTSANPWVYSIEWLTEECERMGRAIELVAPHEVCYLQEDDPNYRAHVIARYHEHLKKEGIEFTLTEHGLPAMLAAIFGRL